MPERRWHGRAVRLGAALLAALLAGGAGGWLLLGSRAGLDFIADRAGRALSDETTTVRVARLSGSVVSAFAVGQVTVADRAGVYATADDIRLRWHPLALLGGTLDIESLSVGRLALVRVPETVAADSGAAASPLGDYAIRVGMVAVRELALERPVLGEAQRLSAAGAARFNLRAMQGALELELKRLDGGADRASVALEYAAHPARFQARARIEEPAGGIVARLAGLKRGERLSVDLSGAGPPDAWRGTLKIEAGRTASATAALAVALGAAGAEVSADGEAKPGEMLPAPWRALAAPALRFRADTGVSPAGSVTVKRLSVESGVLSVSGSGGFAPGDRRLFAALTIATREASALAGLLPGLSVGKGAADVSISGTPEAPRADVSWRAERIGWQTARLAALAGTLALRPAANAAFDLSATARGEGLAPGTEAPPGLLGDALELTATARVGRDGALAPLSVSAASGPAKAEATGTLTGNGVAEGNYALRLESIGDAARAAGVALSGRLNANGTFRAETRSGVARANYSGALADIAGLPPGVAALLGPRLPFAGAAELGEDGRLGVTGFTLTAAAGRIETSGVADLRTGAVSAQARLAVDDLAPLSGLAGVALAGRATANAAIGGSLANPSARGQAVLAGLALGGAPLGGVGVGYTARWDKTGPLASLRLGGALFAKKLDGRLDAALRDGVVALTGIDVALGRNRVTGSLSIDPARARLTLDAAARLDAVADLPGAAPLGLAGTGDIVAVTAADGTGAVDFTVRARELRLGKDGIGAATARLRLRDLFGQPTIAGAVEAENIRLAGLTDGRAKIEVGGGFSKMDWSMSAAAGGAAPVALSGKGAVALDDTGARIVVASLDGKIAGQAVSLRAPFALETRPAGWRVEPVDLALAGGRLRFSGAKQAAGIEAEGRLDALPLRLASLVDPTLRFDGALSGTLRVTGAPARPDVTLSLAGSGIGPSGTVTEDFAGFALAVELRQRGEAAEATATLTGPEDTRLSAAVKTRALLGLAPPSLALGADLPLSGELAATGRLGLIDQLVGLGEDRLAGKISGRATLAGTLGAPTLTGEASLTGGSYEGALTGTVLRNLNARLAFAGDTVRVVSLSADDGGDGRLAGSGAVRFAGAAAGSERMEFTVTRFTALRHPVAEAVASGKVTVSGSLGAPRLAGRLRIDQADIRIPDRLPDDVVELEVVEINGDAAAQPNRPVPAEASASRALAVPLDIKLEFPNRTFVRGRGLDSEWKGALAIAGTTRAPGITGDLQVVRGTFAFAGHTFAVKSGTVTFPAAAAEPRIEATAEAKLKEMLARVTISGEISKPAIQISSEPQLPQEDVLAHILFGRTTGQLNPIQAAQLAQTAATLSGKAADGGIMDKVRRALGVDVLNVESGEEGVRGATLKAGKYIHEDVFVSVSQGAAPGSQKVGVEVQVLPNITVESDVSGTADSNFGVNWKFDY